MMVGPAEFNFEFHAARVLAENGHQVARIRSAVKGKHVEHEIDISLISSNGRRIMAECNYHNSQSTFTGLKDSMNTRAWLLDILERNSGFHDIQMIISNSRMPAKPSSAQRALVEMCIPGTIRQNVDVSA